MTELIEFKKCILLIFMMTPFLLMANGGVVTHFGVSSSGNPHFKEVADVNILREDILIRPQGDRIFVRATYLLQSSSSRQIKYAFPVDYWYSEDKDDLSPESSEHRDRNIRRIEFECNGEILKYEVETPQILENERGENYKMRTWFYTTFELEYGVSKLTVIYELQSEFVYNSGEFYKFAHFSYDFSPAATFGNGIIKEFSMTVDLNDKIIEGEIRDSYQFEKQGKLYTLNISDFDLENAEPVTLTFSYQDSYEVSILTTSWPTVSYAVDISSSTNQYPISNLSDLDFTTVCVIKGDKDDKKWIEISSVNEMNVESIIILNGYYKSEETYYDNNRIKKALVELISAKGNVVFTDTLTFDDAEYMRLNYSNFSHRINCILNVDYERFYDYEHEYEYYGCADDEGNLDISLLPLKIRMTVLEEYKGRKYDDTCISEIFVSMAAYREK